MSTIPTSIGWLLYALAWAAAAVFYALLLVAQRYTTFLEGLASGAVFMGAAGVLGVFVWRLSGRLSLSRRHWLRFSATVLACGLLYASLCLAVQYVWLRLAAGRDIADTVMQQAALWLFAQGLLYYGVVLGLSYLVRTVRRLRQQQLAAARAEAAAARAQLVALRSQLNPHFLFNCLHGLATLVRHDPDAAEASLEDLGTLLRYALDHGSNETVFFADEWEFTRTYLALERRRLGERLRVDERVGEDVLDCAVPPFLLQPLVENAVRHGIGGQPRGGALSIVAEVRENRLHVSVGDDGAGCDPAGVDASEGVGLRVLREQLRARYGARGECSVRTEPGAGFEVRLVLPVESGRALPRLRRESSPADARVSVRS